MQLSLEQWTDRLEQGSLDRTLSELYGADEVPEQKTRLDGLLKRMREEFGADAHMDTGQVLVATSPGRTELGGNHTDHNHGRVLTAAVHLDLLAAAAPSGDMAADIRSHGFDPIRVDLSDTAPRPSEAGTPEAMVRGVADWLKRCGVESSGFRACVHSAVPVGSGLSSSAAFGVLVGRIMNALSGGRATNLDLARAARHAENVHFGKPCGFMDQIACAFMGVRTIDFENPDDPAIELVECDLEGGGYVLAVVDTGGSHANLTPDYAAIPEEMRAAAAVLGREFARECELQRVMKRIGDIRAKAGDRAALRLIHFIEENQRAAQQAEALRKGDMAAFLLLVAASGDSSWRLLQNCYSISQPHEQAVPLALTLSERLLGGEGAWRVQGGGFAGTIQAWVPKDRFEEYKSFMDGVFGGGATVGLKVRGPGSGILCEGEQEGGGA